MEPEGKPVGYSKRVLGTPMESGAFRGVFLAVFTVGALDLFVPIVPGIFGARAFKGGLAIYAAGCGQWHAP